MNVNDQLFQAVRDGNVAQATNIINSHGLSYSKSWEMGYALLQISVRKRNVEMTKLLLNNGAKVNYIFGNHNKRKKFNDTPLYLAAKCGNKEIVELLLAKGANLHAKNQYNGTALQSAVYHQQEDIVKLLIERGASVHVKTKDGATCLHTAVQRTNLTIIETIIQHGVNVNAAMTSSLKNGHTALHIAAEKGDHRIVELLIKNKASVDVKTKEGITPLFLATMFDHENVIKILLENGANVDSSNANGATILQMAIECGNLKLVELILNYRPDVTRPSYKNTIQRTIFGSKKANKQILDKLLQYGFKYDINYELFFTAIDKGYTNVVEECLKEHAKEFLNTPSNKKSPALHLACQKDQYDIIELLVKCGANVNELDEYGKTPLFYATLQNNIKAVELLIENKASPTACSGLLINAVKSESKNLIELFLKLGLNVNECDNMGRTPLHYSALNQSDDYIFPVVSLELFPEFKEEKSKIDEKGSHKAEIAKILLEAGAEVDTRSHEGVTALHNACLKGYFDVVKVLFEYNAKMLPDNSGTLPIHLSAYTDNLDILKMLISKGADVNAKANDGWTPVHSATHEVQNEFLEYLLKHGADVDAKDEHGKTALHIAAENNYIDFVELLLKYGADINSTDKRNRTPFNIATKEGNDRIVSVLLAYGCNIMDNPKNSNKSFELAGRMMGGNIFGQFFNHLRGMDGISDENDEDDDDYDFDIDNDEYNNFGHYGFYGCHYDSDNDDFNDEDMDMYDSDMDFSDDGFGPDFATTKKINQLIQQHTIKMKAANLLVEGEEQIYDYGESEIYCNLKYKKLCEKEVEKLKRSKTSIRTNVTFYDILLKPIESVALYLRNENIASVLLKFDKHKRKFPIYSSLINGKITRAFNRKELLDQGYLFFDSVAASLSIVLPYNCIETICGYLSDKDLRVMVDASEWNKTDIKEVINAQ